MKVSIIGTGYVGLTTGVCLGYLGHKVTCIDSDQKKIGMLQSGKTPIYEPFLTELMAAALRQLYRAAPPPARYDPAPAGPAAWCTG